MNFSQTEQEILDFWQKKKIFAKSVKQKNKKKSYSFYDGPPFITGVPHYGSLLSSVVKDCVPRFWTMKGFWVERRWGWDCHGLPAENMVEQKLGIKSKREIEEKVGIERFNQVCFEETSKIASEWEDIIDRIGRWVEFKGAYKTMGRTYMESVWWAFGQLHKKGLIYQDVRVSLFCPRCSTPLSNFEIAMDNSYQDDTDPSVIVEFPVVGQKNTYFLVWTTTPWTLPGNTALAVGKNTKYVEIEKKDQGVGGPVRFILAESLLNDVFSRDKYKIVKKLKGRDLVGKKYKPIFSHKLENGYRVIAADFVTTEEGTGVVHVAPAFGDDDFAVRQKHNLPIILNVDDEGRFTEGKWRGQKVWTANQDIVNWLEKKNFLFEKKMITHSYPHCHRCHTKLIYKAQPAWFVNIAKLRPRLLKANEKVNWYPGFLKEGRVKKGIEGAPDWNISRSRYWGTPMPVWQCEKCQEQRVVSSIKELGQKIENLHRPFIDRVKLKCRKCGGEMIRIEEVFDGWVESGSMPFAQFHYPFENRQKFLRSFPTDFVSEYIAQTRAWFYVMHVLGVAIFGQAPFKNVVTTGVIAGSDGRKMSKSFGNYTDPWKVLEKYSADALRFYLLSSPLLNAQDVNFSERAILDTHRRILLTIWNSFSFFDLYAPKNLGKAGHGQSSNVLDRWILSLLNQTIRGVDETMQKYNLVKATKYIEDFVDNLSNWYIRRSRERFKRPQAEKDKQQAAQTLYRVLSEFSKVIAPFTPFIAEKIYQSLKTKQDKESVHLCDFPKADKKLINRSLENKMATVREIVTRALAKRAEKQIRIRQPLARLVIKEKLGQKFLQLIADEVNVKEVKVGKVFRLDTKITGELKREGLKREIERFYAQLRKELSLKPQDVVRELAFSDLTLTGKDEPGDWRTKNLVKFSAKNNYDSSKQIKVDGKVIKIGIKK